jgi:hypothetical protein
MILLKEPKANRSYKDRMASPIALIRCAGKGTLFLLLLVVFVVLSPGLRAGRIEHLAAHSAPNSHASAIPQQAGGFDGPAELPRIYIDSSLRATAASGKTVTVRAGEDPSEAVFRASCGDTIQLQAGATFDKLVLPEKPCDDSHWIIVRTSAPDAKLPPEGTRLTPCYAGVSSLPGRPDFRCTSTENVLAKIEFAARAGNGPVQLAPGANHYRLIGLEVTRSESPAVIYNLIGPHDGTADHIVFDRMWLHGTAHDETVRGIMLARVRYAAVVDSYFSDFHCVAKTGTCVDSQAIAGGSGDDPMGPFKIVNNYLEAAGENIIFGGASGTATPADIEIRHNHMFKPIAWLKGQPGFVGGADGSPFIVKNLFEIKNAQRVLFEGNILEDSWGGFSQAGFAILLTPKNQQIGTRKTGTRNVCPSCQVTDITIRNCRISHVAGGFVLGNGVTTNGGAAKDGGRYSIHDVVIDDIQPALYNGRGLFAQIGTAPGETAATPLHDVSINHVTAFPPRVLFNVGGPRAEPRMHGLTITNNIFTSAESSVTSTGGGVERNCASGPGARSLDFVLQVCFSSYHFDHNVIIGDAGGFPKDNLKARNIADVGFSNSTENAADYRLSSHSKFKHAAADQKDPGADIDAIDQATAGAR